jgi:hypothetical protein
MKITVEFDTWEEMEIFRTSGKKTRGKSQMADESPTADEVAEKQAQMVATQAPPQAQAFQPPTAVTAQPQPSQGFPGGNGAAPAPAHPLVAAILARIDGAVGSGQPADAIVTWFRQQIGPDAANASLDQLKQVFIPRMTETQLKQIAPQLGIQG